MLEMGRSYVDRLTARVAKFDSSVSSRTLVQDFYWSSTMVRELGDIPVEHTRDTVSALEMAG